MTIGERTRRIESRFYSAIRHRDAAAVSGATPLASTLEVAFEGHSYCLVVSRTRDGRPIPTPVWFALLDGTLVFESDADSLKLKRIRRNPAVRVAPCSVRGRPLCPPLEATATMLGPGEEAAAEWALDEKYGRVRRTTARLRPMPAAGRSYVRVHRD
jgi:PPOX class probable F420-dependent enzyme